MTSIPLLIRINELDTINPRDIIRTHGDSEEIMVKVRPGEPLIFRGPDAARVCRWLDVLARSEPEETEGDRDELHDPTRGIRRVGDPEPAEGGSATAAGGNSVPPPVVATGRVHTGQAGPGEGAASKVAELPPTV